MGYSMPKTKLAQPINTNPIRIMFFIKKTMVSSPAQEIIPDKNNTTQVNFSFLLKIKSDRYMIMMPCAIRNIPNRMISKTNIYAMSALY
jgi:hypothetical protein